MEEEGVDITTLYKFRDEAGIDDIKEQIRDILWELDDNGKDQWIISKAQLKEWFNILIKELEERQYEV